MGSGFLALKSERAAGRPEGSRRPRRAGPGRPEGSNNLREAILDAAQIEFADLGYAGATLRGVAARANATQALINYYFGSKFALFEEVFLRYGRRISDERLDRLAALKRSGRALRIEDVVLGFLKPTLDLRRSEQGRAFLRLQARLHTEPPDLSYRLRNEAYDASTRAYAEAIMAALPHLSEKEAYWRITLMIGAYLYAFSGNHRLEEMAGGACDPDNVNEILEQMVAFAVGGIGAPARRAGPKGDSKGEGKGEGKPDHGSDGKPGRSLRRTAARRALPAGSRIRS